MLRPCRGRDLVGVKCWPPRWSRGYWSPLLQFELWHAALLGLVEGITEFLPVSSTGHLIVTSQLIGLGGTEYKDAIDAFEVIIQGGAILAVVGLYWPRFVQMLRGLVGKDAAGLRLLVNLVIAFLPAAVIGLAMHKLIKQHLFYVVPVAAAFIVGAIYMTVLDRWKKAKADPGKEIDQLTMRDAALIGALQCVAMWPGTSRSMMTITGGYIAGLRAGAAAEFSFLLGVPTLLAAAGLDLFKDLWHAHKTGGPNLFQVLGAGPTVMGMLIAAVSAAVAIKWLVGFLNRRGLVPFAAYRVVFGVLLLVLAARGVIHIAPEHAATKPAGVQASAPPKSDAGKTP